VRWPGFGPVGGFAEFIPVPARYLIKVRSDLKAEELAPLTDAGLTPYRGIKKLRDAGAIGPDRVLGILGIGGLGGYAVQYAKLLGGGATVVAFARNPRQTRYRQGLRSRSRHQHQGQILERYSQGAKKGDRPERSRCHHRLRGRSGDDAARLQLALYQRPLCRCGLVGDQINVPLFPRVSREQTFHGSYWGNNTDLSEVTALASQGKIRHTIKLIKFDQLNEYIDLMRMGDVVGRAVMKF
jgi:propanol-preferring alcohol dehydrogenase